MLVKADFHYAASDSDLPWQGAPNHGLQAVVGVAVAFAENRADMALCLVDDPLGLLG